MWYTRSCQRETSNYPWRCSLGIFLKIWITIFLNTFCEDNGVVNIEGDLSLVKGNN